MGRYADGLVGAWRSSNELQQAADLIGIPVINADRRGAPVPGVWPTS